MTSVKLPDGEIVISDTDGTSSLWIVTRRDSVAWITKKTGNPDILDGGQIQLVRAYGGRISLRRSLN